MNGFVYNQTLVLERLYFINFYILLFFGENLNNIQYFFFLEMLIYVF